jgi:predicted transcriptional regulator
MSELNLNREGRPEFNLERTLESTGHSEDLIRRLIAEGVHSEEIHKTITRNTEHIKIILGKQEVIDSASPRLAGFQEAVNIGEAFVAE